MWNHQAQQKKEKITTQIVCLLLCMVLWVPFSAMLWRRAVLVLWHAFLFLGLRVFPLFTFLLGGLHCFFL
jgi:uncharacterized membrane protein